MHTNFINTGNSGLCSNVNINIKRGIVRIKVGELVVVGYMRLWATQETVTCTIPEYIMNNHQTKTVH